SLPKLPGGQCYATRGLWVSHDDTQIVSNGACITALGPGPVRLTSPDGDPIAADAVFFVNHSRPLDATPVRVTIRGLRIVVPRAADMFGIGIFAHEVTVRGVTVTGEPIDAITIGGRANGDGYAGRVTPATNLGRMVYGTDIRIVGNKIVGNGVKDTPPQHGGIVFYGGQDGGGGRVLVERNVIRGNRGAGLQGRGDVNLVVVARRN